MHQFTDYKVVYNLGYQCTECGDKYSGAFNFYRHLKYNHEKIQTKNWQTGSLKENSDASVSNLG